MKIQTPTITKFGEFKIKKLEEFGKEFITHHPGDSGMGGNDPQEPVYELNTNEPHEIQLFIANLMDEVAEIKYQELDDIHWDAKIGDYSNELTRVMVINWLRLFQMKDCGYNAQEKEIVNNCLEIIQPLVLRELGGKTLIREPIWECANCGLDIIGQPYENQNNQSEKDEHFCNEDCENAFHIKHR